MEKTSAWPNLAIAIETNQGAAVDQLLQREYTVFAEEVKHRQAERTHTLSLSHGQNYVLRELRVFFAATTDEDQKAMINLLEKAFRGPITRAVNREVVLLRRNGVSGESLLKALARIYEQHNLRDWVGRRSLHATARPVPKIVCSEGLV